jgi:hypothetical protein
MFACTASVQLMVAVVALDKKRIEQVSKKENL